MVTRSSNLCLSILCNMLFCEVSQYCLCMRYDIATLTCSLPGPFSFHANDPLLSVVSVSLHHNSLPRFYVLLMWTSSMGLSWKYLVCQIPNGGEWHAAHCYVCLLPRLFSCHLLQNPTADSHNPGISSPFAHVACTCILVLVDVVVTGVLS